MTKQEEQRLIAEMRSARECLDRSLQHHEAAMMAAARVDMDLCWRELARKRACMRDASRIMGGGKPASGREFYATVQAEEEQIRARHPDNSNSVKAKRARRLNLYRGADWQPRPAPEEAKTRLNLYRGVN